MTAPRSVPSAFAAGAQPPVSASLSPSDRDCFVVPCLSTASQHPVLGGSVAELKREVEATLHTNIFPFWLRMQDEEHGGFYGQMTGDGTLVKEAPKGCILNARILWSFSAAYRVTRRPEYLAAATRAKDYILAHFIDHEYGGCYWSLDYQGRPLDTKKQFYALGFMLYGLSEYYRATALRPVTASLSPLGRDCSAVLGGSVAEGSDALQAALALFDCIEEHSLDRANNGYIEATTRDWQPIADMRLSALDANYPKSQNTHLHIIEPYTNLYRALKERPVPGLSMAGLEKALRNLITIFTDRILNPATHHLDLFFENDWTRGAGHLESYGHDIECSWLLHEAALVLGDEAVLKKVEPIVQLVARASEKGLNPDGSMIHEANADWGHEAESRERSVNLDTAHVDTDRHWWVQAETVVGFYNIYQHFGDESALQKALNCWQYIKDNLIDHDGGEWWWSRDEHGRINRRDDKAGFWKCPYHNSRMCLELMERIN